MLTVRKLLSGARRDFAFLTALVTGAEVVADRCRVDLCTGAPPRATFEQLMERLARIRGRYRDLSPIDQDAIWVEVAGLEAEVRALRRLLVRYDSDCRVASCDSGFLSSRPPRPASASAAPSAG
ncbi:MAG: hypothetical protein HOV80_38320 [Polyangiaceae bacterium]|nr:hypothetical protein [Polyangiaceae bacterium]